MRQRWKAVLTKEPKPKEGMVPATYGYKTLEGIRVEFVGHTTPEVAHQILNLLIGNKANEPTTNQ